MRTFVIQSNRGVEQLVARRAHNPEAGGSSPSPATKKTDVEKSASVCRRMCAETGNSLFVILENNCIFAIHYLGSV